MQTIAAGPPISYWADRSSAESVKPGGGDVAQFGRASDRHAADAGSIPRCGEGFFSRSQLSVQTLLRCPYTPVRNRMHLTSVRTLKIP